jgi:three-Cys-motif partner protein
LKSHSGAKLRLIEHYLDSYFTAVLRNPQIDKLRITLVDGFCGGGAFDDGGTIVQGTPFLMLNAVARAEQRLNINKAKPLTIDAQFHFVDSSKRATDFLKDQLVTRGQIGRLGKDIFVHTGKFEEAVVGIADSIRQRTRKNTGRSLFLLDQKGYTSAPLGTIKSIFDRFHKAECILTFAVDWLIDYLSERPENILAAGKAGLNADQVREFVRMRGEGGGRFAIQRLLLKHIQDNTGAQFVSPFFIRSREAKKTLWLVHLSRVATARNVMVDSHWSVTNHSLHQGRGGLDIAGFDPDQFDPHTFMFAEHERELMMEALAEDMLRRLRDRFGTSPVQYGLFVDGIANETPARLSDIDQAVQRLTRDYQVTVLNPEQRVRRAERPARTDFLEIARQTRFSL